MQKQLISMVLYGHKIFIIPHYDRIRLNTQGEGVFVDLSVIAVIPARGGSKGIPRKNILPLGGIPLIAHSILSAKKSKYIDKVFVSTDDDEIADISRAWGAEVIIRPAELANDTASSESVLLHAAEQLNFDLLVFMQATSPLTSSADLDAAIHKLKDENYDSILSVTKDHGGFLCGGFTWTGDGKSINYDHTSRPRRQDMDVTFRENGAFYITSKEGLLESSNRLSGKIGIYEMPYTRSFEIDEFTDLDLISKIFYIMKPASVPKDVINRIKLVIFDLDGIFTDGGVYVDEKGMEFQKFSRIDGKGIELLKNKGIKVAVISSEASKSAKARMDKLKITDGYYGIKDKIKIYNALKLELKIDDSEIVFCGDDIQDLPVIKKVAFSFAPKNAQISVKREVNYVSNTNGGRGFVREVCNIIIENIDQ
jgi:N-acylneuraminate cytidylyltransferase